MLHERTHVKQIQRADTLVSGGRVWTNGWSWNMRENARGPTHNHWNMGSDGKPGFPGLDDDANGAIDDFPADPQHNTAGQQNYEFSAIVDSVTQKPNRLSPDIPLSLTIEDSTAVDWPRAWGAPPCTALCCENNSYEHQDFLENVTHDNDTSLDAKDWSDPGKQHAGYTPGPSMNSAKYGLVVALLLSAAPVSASGSVCDFAVPLVPIAPRCAAFAEVKSFEPIPATRTRKAWRLTFGEIHHATPALRPTEDVESDLFQEPKYLSCTVFVCMERVDDRWHVLSHFRMDAKSCPRHMHEDVLDAVTWVAAKTSTPLARGEAIARLVGWRDKDTLADIGAYWDIGGAIDAVPIAVAMARRARGAQGIDLGPELIGLMVDGIALDTAHRPLLRLDVAVARQLLAGLLDARSAQVACVARYWLHLLTPSVEDGVAFSTCTDTGLAPGTAAHVRSVWRAQAACTAVGARCDPD